MSLLHDSLSLLFGIIPALFVVTGLGLWIRHRRLRRFASDDISGSISTLGSPLRLAIKVGLLYAGLGLVILCLMRPQYGTEDTIVRRQYHDVLIALDISKSMLVEDISPSRFDRAKTEIRALLSSLKGDRVGLLLFSGSSFMHLPFTLDHDAFLLFLDDVSVGLASKPGTNLASAMRLALKQFPKRSRQFRSVVMYSDGEHRASDIASVSRLARDAGVRFYTVGIGTPTGNPIPIRNAKGQISGYLKDESGKVVVSALTPRVLQTIAQTTRGQYFHSGGSGLVAESLYRILSQYERSQVERSMRPRKKDRYQWFLIIAITLLMIDFVVSDRRRP